MTRRVLITGIGALAPNGFGLQEFWSATLAGRSAIREISRFDVSGYTTKLGGEVAEFDPKDYLPGRLIAQTDHMTRMALIASDWALRDAAVDLRQLDTYRTGVVTASAAGGVEFGQREIERLWRDGPKHVSAYQSFAWFYAVNTGQISIMHGMRGPSGVVGSEQAGGLDALALARRRVRNGCDLILAGGVDGSLCPWGLVSQMATGQLSRQHDPREAYLPFDQSANGGVPGEGGAIMVLEDAVAAARRGAEYVYAEIVGYAATFDPKPGSGRPANVRRAIELALDEADLAPGDIDVVFADGAGIESLDRVEADAIVSVFGPNGVPVSVPKTMNGRLFSGGAALDVAAAVLAIRHDVIPPAVHIEDSGYQLDLVLDEPRECPVAAAMIIARGYGGFNSVLIVKAV